MCDFYSASIVHPYTFKVYTHVLYICVFIKVYREEFKKIKSSMKLVLNLAFLAKLLTIESPQDAKSMIKIGVSGEHFVY